MRTEDLLAACLETRAQGQSPTQLLVEHATADQRAELESLLQLAARLEHLAAPEIHPEVREAMTARRLRLFFRGVKHIENRGLTS
ncbi:MAG TPA: hypothetical protein VKY74_21000 [Chloroflexia bacterium]|nr:hypothetical protein [Chloroflexia bacterium]